MALIGRKTVSLASSVALHTFFAGVMLAWSLSHPMPGKTPPPVPVKIALAHIVIPAKPLPQTPKRVQPAKAPEHTARHLESVVAQAVIRPVTIPKVPEPVVVSMLSEKRPISSPTLPVAAVPLPVINSKPSETRLSVGPEYSADYLENPAPIYPKISTRMGEEGRVMLHVLVSKEGLAIQIDVKFSSGFERLDRAAQTAVQKWKFIPAKRGDESIEGWVNIPINFRLSL